MRLLPIFVVAILLGFVSQSEAQNYTHPQPVSRFYATVWYGSSWKTVPIVNGIAPMVCVTGNRTSYNYAYGTPFNRCRTRVEKRVPLKVKELVKVHPKPKAPTMKKLAPKLGPGLREPSKIMEPEKRITPNYRKKSAVRFSAGVELV